MQLSILVKDFLSLSLDAVAVSYRMPGQPNATLVYVNEAYCKLFGYTASQVIGQPASIGHDDETWQEYCAQVMPAFAAGEKNFATELRCLRADGSRFWASVSLFTFDEPETNGFYSCVTFRDISQLKAREEAATQAVAERDQLLETQNRMNQDLMSTQTRLISAMNTYPAPFVIYDKDLRLVTCNTAYRQSMSVDPDRIRPGMSTREVLGEAIDSGFFPLLGRTREQALDALLNETEVRKPVQDVELKDDVHYRILRSEAQNGDWVVIWMDTTELVRQKRALQGSQDRLMSAINAFPDPFSIYDPDLNLLIWNPAFVENLTDDPGEIFAGMSVKDVLEVAVANGHVPAARGREADWLKEYAPAAVCQTGAEDFEFEGDRHYRIMRSRTDSGETVVLRLNVTESVRQRRALERANHEITFKALHDDLTGLGNRRYLSERFEELSELRRQHGGELAAIHIDLDRFKQINDTIGHGAGDHVLRDVAQRITAHTDAQDLVARIGGDEFVIILLMMGDLARADTLAVDLLKVLSKPSFYEGRECRFGASIGIARTPLSDEPSLLTNSDVALYKAKRAGRGQIATFDLSDIAEMRRSKQLADDIMHGLERAEFIPFFQPQVCAVTGRVVGIEALARWRHPQDGIVTPDVFLPVAADLNVVADIDKMIFETAIDACRTGFEGLDPLPSLSFNVSANRIQFEDLEEIGRRARSYPGGVAFELLETIFLEEESDAFLMHLDRIRELGISLEVDDFGSGRASVVALQRIAPDQLKIDRRLVAPMAEGNSATQLVKSIIEIGHALDIGVIAEGVETAEQARLLADLGAAKLQGFFFSKPISFEDLLDYLYRGQWQGPCSSYAKSRLNSANPMV